MIVLTTINLTSVCEYSQIIEVDIVRLGRIKVPLSHLLKVIYDIRNRVGSVHYRLELYEENELSHKLYWSMFRFA